jgi:hypothetical protein
MQLLDYQRASSKIEAAEWWQSASERLPILALDALLLALPVLVLLGAIDPSGALLQNVLLAPSPLVWIAWALACLSMSLSAEGLIKTLFPASRLSADSQSFLSVLGLANCIAVVSLLWLASSAA